MTLTRPAMALALSAVVLIARAAAQEAPAQRSTAPLTSPQRLQRLEDKEEIRELLIAYGRDFDKGDYRAYSRLFTDDGVWVGAAPGSTAYTGPAAIFEFVSKSYPVGAYPGAFHIMSNMSVEILGDDTATAWSRWTYFVLGADGKPTPFAAGHYEDRLQRVAGAWKFRRRTAFAESKKTG